MKHCKIFKIWTYLMQLMCQPQVGKGPAAASYSTFAARQEQRRLATASKFL